MSQITVLLIAETMESYLDLKHLLGQDDILLCQVERWEDTLSLTETDPPQLIMLDCPGSGVDGLAVCQEIRARYSGLLVLVSEYGDERFHVLALDLGADASLPSTLGTQLVAANVRALLRRFAPARPPSVLTFGRLTVNANRRDAFLSSNNKQSLHPSLILSSKPGRKYPENYNPIYQI